MMASHENRLFLEYISENRLLWMGAVTKLIKEKNLLHKANFLLEQRHSLGGNNLLFPRLDSFYLLTKRPLQQHLSSAHFVNFCGSYFLPIAEGSSCQEPEDYEGLR